MNWHLRGTFEMITVKALVESFLVVRLEPCL